MRSYIAIAALAAVAKAQTATTASDYSWDTSIPTNPPDALDFEGIEAIPEPTYTEIFGLSSQAIAYSTAAAISSAAADVTEDPLTVFPAATDVPLNADGESDSTATVEKRGLYRRTACAPAATISNTYGVDVSSYEAFKADKVIESVANAAATPAGYYQNFKNLKGANSAYAYLGYDQVKTYDVQKCADACTKKAGCLAFNIYFERAPVVEPSLDDSCPLPAAFANLKCSYWGSILDATTANNYGQYQGEFQLGISGSNSYTSATTGGPIDGCTEPQFFNTTILNAPLRDCAGTWTYMGYKLYTNSAYDPRLCKAACDAQSKYDTAHPPSDGTAPAICSGFGSYILTKTIAGVSTIQGQMCTLYTSNWSSKYAVNKVAYNDAIGAKYTYSLSYFYGLTTQPTCKAKRDLVSSRHFQKI